MTHCLKPAGWILLAAGLILLYLSLYLSHSLPLLQSSVLHFFEHMQMLWTDLAVLHQALMLMGLVLCLGSLALLLAAGRRGRAAR